MAKSDSTDRFKTAIDRELRAVMFGAGDFQSSRDDTREYLQDLLVQYMRRLFTTALDDTKQIDEAAIVRKIEDTKNSYQLLHTATQLQRYTAFKTCLTLEIGADSEPGAAKLTLPAGAPSKQIIEERHKQELRILGFGMSDPGVATAAMQGGLPSSLPSAVSLPPPASVAASQVRVVDLTHPH